MEEMIGILVPLGAFAMAFGIVYINRVAANREKMAMIEKGMNPNEGKEADASGNKSLKNGLLFIGAAFGLFVGFLLHKYLGMNNVLALISMAFLFGGVGLVIFYLIDKKNNANKA